MAPALFYFAMEELSPYANLTNGSCSDGVFWVWHYFGECVTTSQHFAAFIIGLISLCLWLIPLFPQIYENYKRGKCDESLSIYFLLCWVTGDTCNLVGSILAHQLHTQIFIAVYYIIQDMVILSQYAYYKAKHTWNRRSMETATLACIVLGSFGYFCSDYTVLAQNSDNSYAVESHKNRRLMAAIFTEAADEIGFALGVVSSIMYVSGRLPQFYQNYKRKSAEGLSLAMFVIMICGNFTYGLSVLLAGEGSVFIIKHLPWLVGSLGCCFLDCIMIGQICYYGQDAESEGKENDETSGLLQHAFDANSDED